MTGPWLVLSLGQAAGEAALSGAFISAARAAGYTIEAWTIGDTYAAHLRDCGAEVRLLSDPAPFFQAAAKADLLVCTTSLTCSGVFPSLQALPLRVVSLESSWLPWMSPDWSRFSRIDRLLIAMPEPVFQLGLRPNQGRFALNTALLERIRPVGWFAPSLSREDGPPNVLIYLGRATEQLDFFAGEALTAAVGMVSAARPALRWRVIGYPRLVFPPQVERVERWVDEATLARWHADADLIISHHGQVTVGRAAAAGVPVLALAKGTAFLPGDPDGYSDFEVHAFARAGVVEAVHGRPPARALAARILRLLDEGRRPGFGGGGAEAAVREMEELLGERR